MPKETTRKVLMDKLIDEGYFEFGGFVQNEVRMSPVVTFKMLAKYYRLSFAEANKITTDQEGIEFLSQKNYTGWLKGLVESLDLIWDDNWSVMEKVMEYPYKWSGTTYNSSIAASSVILTDYQPNLPVRDGAIAGNGHALEDNGYIKYDLLAVSTLDQIEPFYHLDVDWNDVYDPKVWETINHGYTDFVFQFGSPGMKRILEESHTNSVDNLAEANGLYRPGPMSLGMVDDYISASKGELHQDKEGVALSLIMKKLYGKEHSGLIIFQEEVMKLCEDGAGFSLRESDDIRRALGKKIESLLQSYKPKFVNNFKYRSYYDFGEEIGKKLFDQVLKLADGEELTAEEAYERIQHGEQLDIVEW